MELSNYICQDPPKTKIAPRQDEVIVDNDGCKLFARYFVPGLNSSDEKRPAVLFFHGFPGGEKLWDLPLGLRRCGFVSFLAGFRGCWGSTGYYRFSTLLSDAKANLQYMIDHAQKLNIDPDRIYIIGHSMGGFTALRLMAEGGPFKGSVLLAPCNVMAYALSSEKFGLDAAPFLRITAGETSYGMMARKTNGKISGHNEDPNLDIIADINSDIKERIDVLRADCRAHGDEFDYVNLADMVDFGKPMLFLGATGDTSCPIETHMNLALNEIKARGGNPDVVIMDTDHCFQDSRIQFLNTVADWLIKQD